MPGKRLALRELSLFVLVCGALSPVLMGLVPQGVSGSQGWDLV